MSPSSQYPEENFVYEDLDVVRTYINLAFGEGSVSEVNTQNVSAKGGSVEESTDGGGSAACSATTPWLLLQ